MKLRPYKEGDAEAVDAAIGHLREARLLLVSAGARKTAQRVRLALTSAGGAQRHAYRLKFCKERDGA